ncbi:hypothetical protein ACFR99_17595 [Haloarchaeobius amylolyticus]|uniref:Uncharacterized protein n=1 Tax=Haloarchaeobius amylolyticus TaxID=1198296 RepID=A0ABD6BJV4_9EURY
MMWQDLVFMLGSSLSIVFLAPTLRDSSARVPLGTSLPSMGIGFVYATTFFTLGMSFSALGAFAAGSMWSLIALFRSPQGVTMKLLARENLALFVADLQYWLARRRGDRSVGSQYVSFDRGHEQQY